MLRRTLHKPDSATRKHGEPKLKHKKKKGKTALGSKRTSSKTENEKVLEALVLGGDKDVVDSFGSTKTVAKKEVSRKRKFLGTSLFEGEERKAVWEDDNDQNESIAVTNAPRHKGIKQGNENYLSADVYTERLKQRYESVVSTPNWAKLDRQVENSDSDSDVEELLHTTGNYIASSASLPGGTINIKKCTDLNKDSPSQARLTALEFHPSSQVALTAAKNQPFTLFQIDGKNNAKIQTVYVDRFPILNAHFTANGQEVVLGSHYTSFKYYDMMSGRMVNVPKIKGINDDHMSHFRISPDGKFITFLGRHGNIHLLSAKSKELICSLKMNGSVEDLAFTKSGSHMYTFGDDGQVYVWDMNARSCIHRFYDEGCVKGTAITTSPNGQYLVCGSYSGVVNVYDREKCHLSLDPKPVKSIMNLITPCTQAVFNSTSEILAIDSHYTEKAIKLVHFPSMQVFSNYPDLIDKSLRIPQDICFSVNSGYFTVANHTGTALLYRLKHYSNY